MISLEIQDSIDMIDYFTELSQDIEFKDQSDQIEYFDNLLSINQDASYQDFESLFLEFSY